MRQTDKSLLEQMQISDFEIMQRMQLLDLSVEALQVLSQYRPVIVEHIDTLVNEFYERQTEFDEISLLIGDSDTLQRLRKAQRTYVIDLFSGVYDASYVNNRLRIGMVHKRIGVEPKLYLSAVRTLKEIIIRVLREHVADADQCHLVIETLDKLIYFDTTLVFDTYIDSLLEEIENAKERTERYAKSLEEKVVERTLQLELQAKLDPLTNLYNQRAMYDLLRREYQRAKRHDVDMSIVYLDVDNFKQVNDSLGHIKGDELLRNLSMCIKNNVRETDIACRFGGDEFCIILPECSAINAKLTCTKILNEFGKIYPKCTISIGIYESKGSDNYTLEQLIEKADERMYKAKSVTGNSIET